MLLRVALVLEEHVAYIFRVTRSSEPGTTFPVTSYRRTLQRNIDPWCDMVPMLSVRISYKISVEKPEGKKQVGRSGSRRKENIRI
jgi:hypothetical protein